MYHILLYEFICKYHFEETLLGDTFPELFYIHFQTLQIQTDI